MTEITTIASPSTSSSTSFEPLPSERSPRTWTPARTIATGLGISVGLGLVTNLAIFAVGAIGAPLQVATGGEPALADLELGAVVVATVVWLVIGAAGLWVAGRLFTRGFAIWAAGAVAITAASLVPVFAMDVDTGSKVALTLLHVAVAASAVAGHAVARRGRR